MNAVEHKEKVLVAIMGTSPAVLTETLYALIAEGFQGARFIPTKIIVVTTAVGHRGIQAKLQHSAANVYRLLEGQLRRQEKLHSPLADIDIRVAERPMDEERLLQPIEDAHTDEDLKAFADCLYTVVREVTDDPESVMYLSLSGGKKGMSHIAGQVMSLCARAQDRLLHIAATPAGIERCESFFFPSNDVNDRYHWRNADGTPGECYVEMVELQLAEQPFLPLRNLIASLPSSQSLFCGEDFRSVVAALSRQFSGETIEPLRLTLRKSDLSMTVSRSDLTDARTVQGKDLGPQLFAYLLMLAEAAKKNQGLPKPFTLEVLIEYLCTYEATANDHWDPTQRAMKVIPWFWKGAEVPSSITPRLDDMTAEQLAERFDIHARTTQLKSRWSSKQSYIVAKLNGCIEKVLPRGVSLLQFEITHGEPGNGKGLEVHRLPSTWQVDIL